MKIVFHTLCVSPHQLPLAREIVGDIGEENYRYIYDEPLSQDRRSLGWNDANEKWMTCFADAPDASRRLMLEADVLISGSRDLDIFEERAARNKLTIYTSERWFKPIPILRLGGMMGWHVPGWARLLSPRYLSMSLRMRRLLRDSRDFYYFPIGVWAARDMASIVGKNRTALRLPAGASSCPCESVDKNGKFRLWGYFVEPSSMEEPPHDDLSSVLRVVWLGRMLAWKRVDTIIRAVKRVQGVSLDVYGEGPWRWVLGRTAGQHPSIHFHGAVPIKSVRRLMHEHDVYVLSSNGEEGWGATVNEALEEKVCTLGTYEAGASVTMLNENALFHSGDVNGLVALLRRCVEEKKQHGKVTAGLASMWSAKSAASALLDFLHVKLDS